MSKRWLRLPVLLAVPLTVGWLVSAARADVPTEGRPLVTAQALAPLPDGAPIAVEPLDDSDANLRLRDLMVSRLAGHGHPIVPGASLRLRFSAEPVSHFGPRPGATTGDALVASDHQPYTSTNLAYSEVDRIFSAPTDRPEGAIQNFYRVQATLETRDGRTVWTGQATGVLTERNETRLAAGLAIALADAVGWTLDGHAGAPGSTAAPEPARAATALGGLRLPGLSLPELAERR